jgi:flagella basal body P-ring formation protein FlgA
VFERRSLLGVASLGAMALGCVQAHGAQAVTAGRLAEVARAVLLAQEAPAGTLVRFEQIGGAGDAMVADGKLEVRADSLTGRWPRSRVAVPVHIYVDGGVVRSVALWFRVEAWRDGWALSADAPAGTSAGSLRWLQKKVDVATLRETPLQSSEQVTGMRLRRTLRAGTALMLEDFEGVPDVEPRYPVQIDLQYGSIHLHGKGVALASGSKGDTVLVRLDHSDAPVRARVVGPREVEVEL